MLTSVLTEKLTKNKKVFGSTIDKILEVGIKFSQNEIRKVVKKTDNLQSVMIIYVT